MVVADPAAPEWLDLEASERVLVRATPSSNLVLASLIAGVVLMLSMSVVVGFFTDVGTGRLVSFVVLISIVVLIASAFLVTKRREYVVTSERACAAVGLTEKTVAECRLDRVSDVTVEQSGWQKVFNVGTLRFLTGRKEDGVSFELVENPAHLYQRALQFVDVDN